MSEFLDVMEKVDQELMQLIDASKSFKQYRDITATTSSASGLEIKGNLGLVINPKHPLGVSINLKG
ncbi:hypothetical protein G6L14_02325 [Agrobacterium vitis]|uniref:hypothetical protein n=1 Tax=Agrobacterium vitis TaxID=373 RepID=UPI001573800D|nr:hypothetical protein [Agrobacterium vitis]NSY10851.1 hypothetical protein [Agrobacterium vitis]